MVYGNFEKDVVDEKSRCNPIGIYGTLKYSGELILKAYNNVFGVPFHTLFLHYRMVKDV